MASGKEFQDLAQLRLQEAEHLYRGRYYDGCVYLSGYVVEFALKACICKTLKITDYPESEAGKAFKTHDFDALKLLAGLKEQISIGRNKVLFENWSIATAWKPEYRYSPTGTYDLTKAKQILSSIKDDPDGVLTWLSKRW